MNYSDELVQKAFERKLTLSERQELREAYRYEKEQEDRQIHRFENSVKDFTDERDNLNMPRHRALERGIPFEECPICYRNRNTNTSILKIHNDMRENPDDYCMKASIHNEQIFAIMIQRERIDLDESKVI